ncbi:MAG: HEAT repeat domain-containing protein [Pirellulales bacterium]|nr:HEAT repeat domain-containing protein [Pirellulales bacterium]
MPSSIPPSQRAPVSSDELLPPIEPPSAGFILQLFVIPLLIVTAVLSVGYLVVSMASTGEQDPERIVAALRSSNQARFQRAKDLADMLRLPERYPGLKANRELAQKLADYMNDLVKAGDPSDAEVAMRFVVARALGDFNVSEGLPALINAALNDPERDVRRQAVNAIAVHAGSMADLKQPLVNDELTEALLKLADDEDELIRSETTFALGVVATNPAADPRLVEKLEELADDPYTDARFNSAAWLARIGSPRAVDVIVEMLDPEAIDSSASGEKPMTAEVTEQAVASNKSFKRKVMITNALKSIDDLLASKSLPPESLVTLQHALERFIAALPEMGFSERVQIELLAAAERTREKVKSRLTGSPTR